jgi:hypothetical protein
MVPHFSSVCSLLFLASLAPLTAACDSPLFSHLTAAERDALVAERNLQGCVLKFPKTGLCASLEWLTPATSETEGEARLRFWNPAVASENGPFVNPGPTVFMKLWMPSMGHGSSPVTTAPERDASGALIPGLFRSTRIFFVMPGDWDLVVQIRDGSRVLDEAKLALEI